MDPDTEKHLAKLIMEEATRLRMQADKEGVHAYLAKPKWRGRPNSQFLTATVRGVQQANRMVEVNEMWRVREKELELEKRMRAQKNRYSFEQHRNCPTGSLNCNSQGRSNSKCMSYKSFNKVQDHRNQFNGLDNNAHSSGISKHFENYGHSSAERVEVDEDAINSSESDEAIHDRETFSNLEDEGLRDEDIEDFLRSRVKRGRGAIGPRMDEPGPYPLSQKGESSAVEPLEVRVKEDWEQRVIGPSMLPLTWTDNSVGGLEKLKKKDSKTKRKRDRGSLDGDKETKSKKSKKKHDKRKKLEKEKRKKKKK